MTGSRPTSCPGSSPLTRGKQVVPRRQRQRRGLIPAHAGKTLGDHVVETLHRAHPRSRGENRGGYSLEAPPSGSSPLTRGKPRWGWFHLEQFGLIPAHAGKTSRYGAVRRSLGAHPRSRGENNTRRTSPRARRGSSPLTRGKPSFVTAMSARLGLIPAHAGKTVKPRSRIAWLKAHPRSRGENTDEQAARAGDAGSSPLTRGKREVEGLDGARHGLIPAHAGKTS